MAFKNAIVPIIGIATILLLLLAPASATADVSTKCSDCQSTNSSSFMHEAARDAIYLAGREVHKSIDFARAIPKLDSFRDQQDASSLDALVSCTDELQNYLIDLQGALDEMKGLKTRPDESDIDSLRGMWDQIKKYNSLCDFPIDNDITKKIVLMVSHKCNYIWLIVNDVLDVLDKLEEA